MNDNAWFIPFPHKSLLWVSYGLLARGLPRRKLSSATREHQLIWPKVADHDILSLYTLRSSLKACSNSSVTRPQKKTKKKEEEEEKNMIKEY